MTACARIAEYARGIGAEKSLIIPRGANNDMVSRQHDLVARAHAANLVVHPWTFGRRTSSCRRRCAPAIPARRDYMRQHGNLDAELRAFYAAGVDGVFSDDPAAAVAARGCKMPAPCGAAH